MTEQHAVERNALIHPCTVATTYQTLSSAAQLAQQLRCGIYQHEQGNKTWH